MNRKYDIRICGCGRIHAIPKEKIDEVLENNKEFLLICAACGYTTLIGADIATNWNDPAKKCYEMYTRSFSLYENREINDNIFKGSETEKAVGKILYSHGVKVPMKTGRYATDFSCGRFSDRCSPDFSRIRRCDVTVKEVTDFIEEYMDNRTTVNMNRFINETPDDILQELSSYWIEGLNWEGTKYWKK